MKKYKVGFLCGFFDPLHDGHIDIMRQAKEMCERLIVAVGTDDQVVPEVDLDKVKAYHQYHFDLMIAGADHLSEPIYQEAKEKLEELGVDTIFVPRKKNISSTLMRKRMHDLMKE